MYITITQQFSKNGLTFDFDCEICVDQYYLDADDELWKWLAEYEADGYEMKGDWRADGDLDYSLDGLDIEEICKLHEIVEAEHDKFAAWVDIKNTSISQAIHEFNAGEVYSYASAAVYGEECASAEGYSDSPLWNYVDFDAYGSDCLADVSHHEASDGTIYVIDY